MGIEDDAGACRGTHANEATDAFVYEAGRTLYMMPFTDAEEEEAWDRAAEAMRR